MTWLALLLAFGAVQSGTPTAAGDVTDSSGLTLPGVVVTVKGTTLLAVSDDRGHFVIELAGSEPVLVFALSGFQTREWFEVPA